jgi:hypothetical protein
VHPVFVFHNVEMLFRADTEWSPMEQASFALVARWLGFMAVTHLSTWITAQRTGSERGELDLSPTRLLVRAGVLGRFQAEAIAACLKDPPSPSDEMDLLQLAVAHEHVSPDHVESVLTMTAGLKGEQLPVPPMFTILLVRRILDDDAVLRLLRRQLHQKRGLLFAVRRHMELAAVNTGPAAPPAPATRSTLLSGTFVN